MECELDMKMNVTKTKTLICSKENKVKKSNNIIKQVEEFEYLGKHCKLRLEMQLENSKEIIYSQSRFMAFIQKKGLLNVEKYLS